MGAETRSVEGTLAPGGRHHDRAIAEFIEYTLAENDIGRLLWQAVEMVVAELPASHVIAMSPGYGPDSSRRLAGTGWGDRGLDEVADHLVRAGKAAPADGHGVVIQDTANGVLDWLSLPLARQYGLRAGVVVGVPGHRTDGEMLGAFASGPRQFSAEDARFLQSMANVLALVVGRAQQQGAKDVEKIVQAKREWQIGVDTLPLILCLIDETGHVIRTNRALESWRLGRVESVRGMPVDELLCPVCDAKDCPAIETREQALRSSADGADAGAVHAVCSCEAPDCHSRAKWQQAWQAMSSGRTATWEAQDRGLGRDIRLTLRRSSGVDGARGVGETGYGLLVIEDITEQKRAERILRDYNSELQREVRRSTRQLRKTIEEQKRDKEALVASEKRYSRLVKNTITGIYILRGDDIVFCNDRFAEMFGYEASELCGIEVRRVLALDEVCQEDGAVQAEPNPTMHSDRLLRGVTKGGHTLWIKTSCAEIEYDGEPMILGNAIDMTEQVRTESALRRSGQELRVLSDELLSAQENERKRIASELHDCLGQQLSAIKFTVENIMSEAGPAFQDAQAERLRSVIRQVKDSVEEVRRISMDLRPSMLDDIGILATITWFCREYRATFPELELVSELAIDEHEVPDTLKEVIFRIVQEAFNNIAKHAKAGVVRFRLAKTRTGIRLYIGDNGQGFGPGERTRDAGGFGLKSMRERARLSGGRLRIRSRVGAGTTVLARWTI